MILSLLKGFQHSSRCPSKSPASEQEIQNALSTLYLSTYRADYLGTHRGLQLKTETGPTSKKKRAVPQCFVTEMKHSYRHPQNLAKLKNNTSRYGCNILHGVVVKGIVPNVFHGQNRSQETKKHLANKSKQTRGKTVDNQGMLASLKTSEQQPVCGQVLGKDKQLFQAAPSNPAQKMEHLPAVCPQATEPVPAWISEWPGPL
ncbi:testis-expressed sequence 26 protein-like isoform X1 [Arapaima gigas]